MGVTPKMLMRSGPAYTMSIFVHEPHSCIPELLTLSSLSDLACFFLLREEANRLGTIISS